MKREVDKSIGISIWGGTGYGAGELLRLLTFHNEVEVCEVISSSNTGKIADAHTHLAPVYPDLAFSNTFNPKKLEGYSSKFLFLATPHKVSGELIAKQYSSCKENNITIIDLSGAYRLSNGSAHSTYYPEVERSDELLSLVNYGLTECNLNELSSTKEKNAIVANPGCLATASILSLAPLTKKINPIAISIDAKTGSSGSGKTLKATTHHPERHGNFTAYKPLVHQHEPEIVQALSNLGLPSCSLTFAAQSLPISRGIYVTTHIHCQEEQDSENIAQIYNNFYANSPFITITTSPPNLKDVIGTNMCHISCAARDKTLLITSCIDNLVKGMAGQAIQNMNTIAGLEESHGLILPALRP